MALFVTKEGKRKSPMAVTCFFVDLLFCLVFGGMYALLTGVLHDHLPLGGGMAENWIHCGLIAVVGTAVCCILFLLPDKRIVPYSFASLPVITIMCVVAAFQLEPAARNMMLYVTFLYTLSATQYRGRYISSCAKTRCRAACKGEQYGKTDKRVRAAICGTVGAGIAGCGDAGYSSVF